MHLWVVFVPVLSDKEVCLGKHQLFLPGLRLGGCHLRKLCFSSHSALPGEISVLHALLLDEFERILVNVP